MLSIVDPRSVTTPKTSSMPNCGARKCSTGAVDKMFTFVRQGRHIQGFKSMRRVGLLGLGSKEDRELERLSAATESDVQILRPAMIPNIASFGQISTLSLRKGTVENSAFARHPVQSLHLATRP